MGLLLSLHFSLNLAIIFIMMNHFQTCKLSSDINDEKKKTFFQDVFLSKTEIPIYLGYMKNIKTIDQKHQNCKIHAHALLALRDLHYKIKIGQLLLDGNTIFSVFLLMIKNQTDDLTASPQEFPPRSLSLCPVLSGSSFAGHMMLWSRCDGRDATVHSPAARRGQQ